MSESVNVACQFPSKDCKDSSILHWQYSLPCRDLLVSVRFSDHGWDWSGGFAPDQLGDTQVKVRNHSSGAMQMLRVEVSTMTSSSRSTNKDVGSGGESLGTCLILLSDDETGFMPYRIDNFSMEVDLFYWFSIFLRACHLCLPSWIYLLVDEYSLDVIYLWRTMPVYRTGAHTTLWVIYSKVLVPTLECMVCMLPVCDSRRIVFRCWEPIEHNFYTSVVSPYNNLNLYFSSDNTHLWYFSWVLGGTH